MKIVIRKKVSNLESFTNTKKTVCDSLANKMDKKIETFEEKMNTFLGVIKEKDNIICEWETKFNLVEVQISEKFTYLDKVITELKSENKSLRNKILDRALEGE